MQFHRPATAQAVKEGDRHKTHLLPKLPVTNPNCHSKQHVNFWLCSEHPYRHNILCVYPYPTQQAEFHYYPGTYGNFRSLNKPSKRFAGWSFHCHILPYHMDYLFNRKLKHLNFLCTALTPGFHIYEYRWCHCLVLRAHSLSAPPPDSGSIVPKLVNALNLYFHCMTSPNTVISPVQVLTCWTTEHVTVMF